MSKIQEISFNFNNLENMPNLRFLKFHGENKCHISDFEDKAYNFPKLRYLHWCGYPLKSLPIQGENLISLELRNSKVEQLWDGIQNVVNLKEIHLDYSERLTRLPDLSKAQNLEKLVLNGCSSLVETPSSIQYLNKLVTLSLFSCKSLRSLPRSIHSKSLEYLYLSGCSNLESFPELSSNNLYQLDLSETAIEEIPSCIGCQSRLVRLNLANCSKLKSLPISLCKLKSLECLHLPICSNLQRLLDELGDLEALQRLNVRGTAIGRPPFFFMTFTWLSHSTSIFFETAKGHEHMAGFILSVSFLHRLHSLKYLYLTGCGITELPESLGQLFSLEELHLANNYFERIPESIINLSKLKSLHLWYCVWLESLPNLPCNLQYMDAAHCTSLQVLSCLSIFKLTRLYRYTVESFHLSNCHKLDVEKSDGANFIFPGSEIPEWFKNQSMGSSISVKLPPVDWDEFRDTLAGFAFGIIVALDKHHHRKDQSFSLHYKITVKTEDGDWHFAFGDFLHILSASVLVDSEHVLLGYQLPSSLLPQSSSEFGFIDEFSVEFYLIKCHDAPLCVECWSPSRSEDCCVPGRYVECYFPGRCVACCKAVRKCGIHLLYAQNLEESKEDRSTDEEEEH
ncbi:Disease resistance protein [Melia azedarach]|uniref:Disease resistance protein n=1 Tax=Melia azedarach TaxID=155640 RepID=A0ACC1YEF8_MELAZ|nr:Disease resistance protein [Melia azedarach]